MSSDLSEAFAVILNPQSGDRNGAQWLPAIEGLASQNNGHVYITEYPGHASQLARSLCSKPGRLIFAAGGDDTVREVLDGMFSSRATFGVIPLGTFNNFAHSLCLPSDPEAALALALKGVNYRLDVGKIENGPFFLENLGIGLDAEAFKLLAKEKPGRIARWLTGFKLGFTAILNYIPKRLAVTIDGHTVDENVMQVIVANAKYYGSGIEIAPKAQLDDGLLDVCIIPFTSKSHFLASTPIYYYGRHLDLLNVKYYQGRKITISAKLKQPVRVDGMVTTRLPIKVHALHKALRIRLPQSALKLLRQETETHPS